MLLDGFYSMLFSETPGGPCSRTTTLPAGGRSSRAGAAQPRPRLAQFDLANSHCWCDFQTGKTSSIAIFGANLSSEVIRQGPYSHPALRGIGRPRAPPGACRSAGPAALGPGYPVGRSLPLLVHAFDNGSIVPSSSDSAACRLRAASGRPGGSGRGGGGRAGPRGGAVAGGGGAGGWFLGAVRWSPGVYGEGWILWCLRPAVLLHPRRNRPLPWPAVGPAHPPHPVVPPAPSPLSLTG